MILKIEKLYYRKNTHRFKILFPNSVAPLQIQYIHNQNKNQQDILCWYFKKYFVRQLTKYIYQLASYSLSHSNTKLCLLLFNPNLCYLLTTFSYHGTFYVILNTKGGVRLKVLKRNVFKAISALLLSTVVVSGVNIPFSSVVGVNSTTAYAQSDDGYWDNFAKSKVPKHLWNKYQQAKAKQGACIMKGIWSAVAFHKLSWSAAIQAAYNASSCHSFNRQYS